MMKFFRKYNKQLLAVFVVLLMLVFVGGSALESLLRPQPDSGVVGHVAAFGQDLTGGDFTRFQNETVLLDQIGYLWSRFRYLGTMLDPTAEPLEPLRVLQKLDNLGDFILGFLDAGHVGERDVRVLLRRQAMPRSAEIAQHPRPAAGVANLAEQEEPNERENQNPGNQRHQQMEQYLLQKHLQV